MKNITKEQMDVALEYARLVVFEDRLDYAARDELRKKLISCCTNANSENFINYLNAKFMHEVYNFGDGVGQFETLDSVFLPIHTLRSSHPTHEINFACQDVIRSIFRIAEEMKSAQLS